VRRVNKGMIVLKREYSRYWGFWRVRLRISFRLRDLMGTRVIHAMSRDGLFFRAVSRVA
jgi:hypothetical protein